MVMMIMVVFVSVVGLKYDDCKDDFVDYGNDDDLEKVSDTNSKKA